MTTNYFKLIPSNGSYKGEIDFPEKVKSNWIEIPQNVINIADYERWVSNGFPNKSFICILLSIWSGVDIYHLNFLIELSMKKNDFIFTFQMHEYLEFRFSFLGNDQLIHSPIVLIGSNGKVVEFFNGMFDREILLRKINEM